jgi:hypothetical protein
VWLRGHLGDGAVHGGLREHLLIDAHAAVRESVWSGWPDAGFHVSSSGGSR